MGGNLTKKEELIKPRYLNKNGPWILETKEKVSIYGKTNGPSRHLVFIREDNQRFFDETGSKFELKWQFMNYKDTEIGFSCVNQSRNIRIDDSMTEVPGPSVKGTYIPKDASLNSHIVVDNTHTFTFKSRSDKTFWIEIKIEKG